MEHFVIEFEILKLEVSITEHCGLQQLLCDTSLRFIAQVGFCCSLHITCGE